MSVVTAVKPEKLIRRVASYLKEAQLVKPPPWTPFVKTGVHKERVPEDPDWWYVRCAAILRKLYLKGPLGTSKLRTMYGGRHRMGHRPPKFAKGSGSIIRKVLQQLEAAGLVTRLGNKGRVLTDKGRELLLEAARAVSKG